MTLDDMIQLGKKQAESILIGSKITPDKTAMIPVFLVQMADGQIAIFATPWRGDAEKEAMLKTVKKYMRKMGVTAYSTLSEAWMASYSKSEWPTGPGKTWPATGPAQHPERVKVVVCGAATASERKMMAWQIVPDPEGRVIELKDLTLGTDSAVSGLMLSLLEQ